MGIPMIHVVCRTNLDLSMERWPTSMPALPAVGHRIVSATKHGHFQLSLEVVAVTWQPCSNGEWIPEIELHMNSFQRELSSSRGQKGSLCAFYEWYSLHVGRSVREFI